MMSSYFFITSFWRSGSNWLRNCLDFSDKVALSGEIYPAENIRILESMKPGDSVSQRRLVKSNAYYLAIRSAITELMRGNFDEFDQKSILIGDKSAYGLNRQTLLKKSDQISTIQKYFPEAKQFLIIRDLRDVVVSYSKWPAGKNLLSLNPLRLIRFILFIKKWCSMNEQWLRDSENNSQCLTVFFENLKHDFDSVIKKVYSHLEIELSDNQLDQLKDQYYDIESKVYQDANKKLGYDFYRKGGVGEWQKSFKWFHKILIRWIAGKKLKTFGYS